jgi:hypothetical protein
MKMNFVQASDLSYLEGHLESAILVKSDSNKCCVTDMQSPCSRLTGKSQPQTSQLMEGGSASIRSTIKEMVMQQCPANWWLGLMREVSTMS